MANKNLNKLIAFAAITGAAIAAGVAFFKHKNDTDLYNDDFDEEEEDFDFPLPTENDDTIKREYVSINLETESRPIDESNIDALKVDESNVDDLKVDESTSDEMSITEESNYEDASKTSTEPISFNENETN